MSSFRLLESGDKRLLESGDDRVLEDHPQDFSLTVAGETDTAQALRAAHLRVIVSATELDRARRLQAPTASYLGSLIATYNGTATATYGGTIATSTYNGGTEATYAGVGTSTYLED